MSITQVPEIGLKKRLHWVLGGVECEHNAIAAVPIGQLQQRRQCWTAPVTDRVVSFVERDIVLWDDIAARALFT